MSGILDSAMPWVTLTVGIVIGVLTSLAAAYVKPLIDNQIGKYFSRIRNRNEARRSEWEAEVSSLVGDSEKRHQLSTKANSCLLNGVQFGLVTTWMFLLSVAFFYVGTMLSKIIEMILVILAGIMSISGIFFFWMSMKEAEEGNRYLRMVEEAEKRV